MTARADRPGTTLTYPKQNQSPGAPRIPVVRRRIRSAAFPVHRHSLPQIVVDGVLVALAYFLAFRLRFDNFTVPTQYEELFEATIPWVVPVVLIVLAGFGLYQRLWNFVGQRDYEGVVKGAVVATLVIVGAIALLHPVQTPPSVEFRHSEVSTVSAPVTLPASVIALFLLLALALLIGARFLVHLVVEGRVRNFRAARDARDVLIVGGGQGGRLVVRELARNPQLRLRPVGFIDDDPRKAGIRVMGYAVLGGFSALAVLIKAASVDAVVISARSIPPERLNNLKVLCAAESVGLTRLRVNLEALVDVDAEPPVRNGVRQFRA